MSVLQTLKGAVAHNILFYTLTGISVVLVITSFIVPPTGVIDSSVLAATGELFAFAALGAVYKGIDKGVDATVTHKDTTLTLNNPECGS